MANNLDFNEGIINLSNITEYPNSFKRQGAFPLERFSVFSTYAALEDYAMNNPIAYVGQLLVLVNDDNTATTYVIQNDGSVDGLDIVTEVGKATEADGKSIVLTDDVLSLNDFGVRYYAYDSEAGAYKTTATEGWKDGLEPAIVGGKLVWREQNTSTISGLIAQVEANKSAIEDLDDGKADKATTLSGYGITDAYTKDETKSQITEAVAGLGTVFELKATVTSEVFNAWAGSVSAASEALGVTLAAGDVILVSYIDVTTGNNLNTEYVVVDKSGILAFEMLGDPSGVTALASRMDTAETDIKTNADAISTLSTNLDTYETTNDATIGNIEDRLDGLDATVAKKADKATTLSGYGITDAYTTTQVDAKVKTLTEADTTLDGKIGDVADDLAEHIEAYTEYKTATNASIATNKTATETNATAIAGLQTTVDGKADKATTLSGYGITDAYTKTEVDAKVTVLTDDIDANSADIDDLETEVSGIKTDVATNTASIATLNSTVGDSTTGLVKSVNTNTSDIASMKTSISTINTDLGNKVDTSTYTSKVSELETAINTKATKATTLNGYGITNAYTKTEVDGLVDDINDELAKKLVAGDAMVFKGLLGDGGVSALPTTDVNNGDTYKVVTAGTYATGETAQVGDMYIAVVPEGSSGTIEWVLVPSGDDGNVYHNDNLVANGVVLGVDSKTIKTLAAGTTNNGKVLKVVSGAPAWADETKTTITSNNSSIDVTASGTTYDVSIKSVNCNLLTQTSGDYLIFDCGSSTVNI